MLGQSLNEKTTIETFVDDIVKQHHDLADLIADCQIDNLEIVLGIQHVQVFDDLLVGDVPLTE